MKLNKKGYMLVEIILASALAFGLAFFIIDLVIRLKNKNNDLLVETLITTDKTIITNKLMSYAKLETKNFDCNKLTITGNTVKYKDEIINIITDYANVGELSCSTKAGKVSITIPISVPQMPNKDYDITFDYKYEIGDITPPTCTITVNGTTITATFQDNDGGSGINGEYSKTATINSVNNYVFTGEDYAGNSKSCSVGVIRTSSSSTYTCKTSCIGGSCTETYCKSGKYLCNDPTGQTACGNKACCDSVGGRWYFYCNRGYSTRLKSTPCSSGWSYSDGACYKYNQSNCSGSTVAGTNTTYYCPSGYTKINDSYCYNINH